MHDNTCIRCGRIIPEGRQVCPSCEQKYTGGCTDCVHAIDDFGRCLIAKMFDRRVNSEHGCSWKVPIKRRAIQTNGDRIRQMTDEELAALIANENDFCSLCAYKSDTPICCKPLTECTHGFYEWLKQEAIEDGES